MIAYHCDVKSRQLKRQNPSSVEMAPNKAISTVVILYRSISSNVATACNQLIINRPTGQQNNTSTDRAEPTDESNVDYQTSQPMRPTDRPTWGKQTKRPIRSTDDRPTDQPINRPTEPRKPPFDVINLIIYKQCQTADACCKRHT